MSTNHSPLLFMNVEDAPCDLRIVDASKRYDGFALDGVSLDVPRGSIVGLIGQNGAGKTTIMRSILGITHLGGGHVELFGRSMATLSEAERIALSGRVGFVGAVTAYPGVMTMADVATMMRLAYPDFDRTAFDAMAARLGLLPGSWGKRVKDLSRGMGMKLQIACALSSGADLVIMDEPTAGLDPIVREEVLDVIREWMEPGTRSALVSSHITTDLERLADYLVLIDQGRTVLSCERDQLDQMGVAHLRSSELDTVLSDGFLAGPAHTLRHDLSCDLLVPDRAAFLRAYPSYVCDRASIDNVMVLLVKGEVR